MHIFDTYVNGTVIEVHTLQQMQMLGKVIAVWPDA